MEHAPTPMTRVLMFCVLVLVLLACVPPRLEPRPADCEGTFGWSVRCPEGTRAVFGWDTVSAGCRVRCDPTQPR
jgi:hypothetical protein